MSVRDDDVFRFAGDPITREEINELLAAICRPNWHELPDLVNHIERFSINERGLKNPVAQEAFESAQASAQAARNSLRAAHAFAVAGFNLSQYQVAKPISRLARDLPTGVNFVADLLHEKTTFEVVGAPLKGTFSDPWHIYIDDYMMSQNSLCVVVYANVYVDGVYGTRALPISEHRVLDEESPEHSWTVSQWVEFARPRAETYISALHMRPDRIEELESYRHPPREKFEVIDGDE